MKGDLREGGEKEKRARSEKGRTRKRELKRSKKKGGTCMRVGRLEQGGDVLIQIFIDWWSERLQFISDNFTNLLFSTRTDPYTHHHTCMNCWSVTYTSYEVCLCMLPYMYNTSVSSFGATPLPGFLSLAVLQGSGNEAKMVSLTSLTQASNHFI